MPSRVSPYRTQAHLSSSTALVIVDQRPIQRRIWSEFHQARKLQEKAARDLHRHEKTDTPAFERWLHSSFPTEITRLREMHSRIDDLSRQIDSVQYMASLTGRAVKKIWREHQQTKDDPEIFARKLAAAESEARARIDARRKAYAAESSFFDDDDEDDIDDFFESLFGEDDEDDFHGENARANPHANDRDTDDPDRPLFDDPSRRSFAADDAARDLYRRLVQRLHPDRGGDWTPARERLWHEVQQAWDARDSDWLARLEIEWETAHDLINESSSISRLRQAIEELHAARRDTERKLRHHRKTPAWRFTLAEKKRPQLHRRTEVELNHDFDVLRRQLDYLQRTIAAWEEPAPSRKSRQTSRGARSPR